MHIWRYRELASGNPVLRKFDIHMYKLAPEFSKQIEPLFRVARTKAYCHHSNYIMSIPYRILRRCNNAIGIIILQTVRIRKPVKGTQFVKKPTTWSFREKLNAGEKSRGRSERNGEFRKTPSSILNVDTARIWLEIRRKLNNRNLVI